MGLTVPLKGQQREIFWSRFFSWIHSICAPDFEAKRIFFSFLFSQSYSNFSMFRRSSLLRGFKIIDVAYCAHCHSPQQPTAPIVIPHNSLLRLSSIEFFRKCPRCRLLRGFKISAVAYCAFYHSPQQPTVLMEESAQQPTALIDDPRNSLLC